MSDPSPSDIFTTLAQVCAALDLQLLDGAGGLFVPADRWQAADLRTAAKYASTAVAEAAQAHGVLIDGFPPISVFSKPARADGEPGVLVRMVSMVRSADDAAWDAAARLDLPGALGQLAIAFRAAESAPVARDEMMELIETASHVCSLLSVLAGLAETAADAAEEA